MGSSGRTRGWADGEQRVAHPVTGLDAEPLRGAAGELQHRRHRPPGTDHAVRHRLGAGLDAVNDAVGAYKEHVERDVGVVHPHAELARLVVVKQHALVVGQLGAKHQPDCLLLAGPRPPRRRWALPGRWTVRATAGRDAPSRPPARGARESRATKSRAAQWAAPLRILN